MNNKLVLFCGPSGSGKTTIVRHLLEQNAVLSFSISATTRSKRSNEVHGKDYYFLSVDEFKNKIHNNEFIEWEEVYTNGFYGTLRSEVERISSQNQIIIFDVDVVGGISIKAKYGNNLLDIFIMPPGVDDIKKRLIARATETPESLQKRIDKASLELTYSDKFSHVIINETLKEACDEAQNLLNGFLK